MMRRSGSLVVVPAGLPGCGEGRAVVWGGELGGVAGVQMEVVAESSASMRSWVMSPRWSLWD